MSSIFAKLIKVQNQLKVSKNQTCAYKGTVKYKFRSAEDILEAAKPLLLENGLTVMLTDKIKLIGDRYYVESTAILVDIETGDTTEVTASAREDVTMNQIASGAQVTGACSSYARKYALSGLFAIDDTKDADTIQSDNSRNRNNTYREQSRQQPKKQEKIYKCDCCGKEFKATNYKGRGYTSEDIYNAWKEKGIQRGDNKALCSECIKNLNKKDEINKIIEDGTKEVAKILSKKEEGKKDE